LNDETKRERDKKHRDDPLAAHGRHIDLHEEGGNRIREGLSICVGTNAEGGKIKRGKGRFGDSFSRNQEDRSIDDWVFNRKKSKSR